MSRARFMKLGSLGAFVLSCAMLCACWEVQDSDLRLEDSSTIEGTIEASISRHEHKIEVCHHAGHTFFIISIEKSALSDHLEHGDHPVGPEQCDGIDNDCDGQIDEDHVPVVTICGVGACANTGATLCVDGIVMDSCIPGSPATETCDGQDNDCNSKVDDDLTAPLAVKQAGVCAGQVQVCQGACGWGEPDFASISGYEATETICDGKDNDCDGKVDEGCQRPFPTGQTKCYNDTVEIPCPDQGGSSACGGVDFCGQDAQYRPQERVFTCYNGDGTVQNPCDSTADPNEVVVDSLTGLMWQRQFIPGKTLAEAVAYCDGLTDAGYSDWRLPEPLELFSIVDFGQRSPTIDTMVFPGYQGFIQTSAINNNIFVFGVDFNFGWLEALYNTSAWNVRCVRGSKYLAPDGTASRFVPAGTEGMVVADEATGLMWQKDYSSGKPWKEALRYCEELVYGGYADWRLPNIKELASVLNFNRIRPLSDFPNMPTDGTLLDFWSSTTETYDTSRAMQVLFSIGFASPYSKANTSPYSTSHGLFVRCVR